ncbi:MAG: hypothetical protein Q8L73_05130 [Methylotenera sp.]|nr:hypothetical protein [Methylotenera sp.]
MGYHVHILRKKNGRLKPILRSELETLVSIIPNLSIKPANLKSSELTLVASSNGKEIVWLTLQNGELWTKNPQENELQVMLEIADKLGDGARVRGDEFETYKSLDETYIHPNDVKEKEDAERLGLELIKNTKRTSLYFKYGIILFFILIGLVGFFIGKMFE